EVEVVNQGIEVQEVTSFGPVEQGEDLARREFFGGYRGGQMLTACHRAPDACGHRGLFRRRRWPRTVAASGVTSIRRGVAGRLRSLRRVASGERRYGGRCEGGGGRRDR